MSSFRTGNLFILVRLFLHALIVLFVEGNEYTGNSLLPSSSTSLSSLSSECPGGWLAFNGNCYKTVSHDESFEACDTLCAAAGATMLCIPDAATNIWVGDNLMSERKDIWVGLSDLQTEGVWEWASGCESTYYSWQRGRPNGGNCVRMRYNKRPDWDDVKCKSGNECPCQFPAIKEPSLSPSRDPTHQPTKSPTLPPTLSPVSESECDDGWLAYDGNCYKMVSHDETFESCDALCATEGATMLCIPDAATNAWVGNNLMTSGADLWIGLSDEATEGQWEWASGCSSTYFDWNSGAPGGGTRENCVRIQYGSRPKWNDRECYFGFDCACQYNPAGGGNAPTLSPIAIAAPSSPTCSETCPDGWAGFGSKCYKSVSTDQKWSECEATCANHGAQMLCIEDAATNQWVSDNLMTTTDLWLGLTDVEVEGDWEWRSGCASTYFDWGFGGPNGGSSSNCARIVYSVRPQWNDRQCNAYRYDCACEIEKDLLCSSPEETDTPSQEPTRDPTMAPSKDPTNAPTPIETVTPTTLPTQYPTIVCPESCCHRPSLTPTQIPTRVGSIYPTSDCLSDPQIFPEPSEQEIELSFESIDLNGDGYLDYNEIFSMFGDEACSCCNPLTEHPTAVVTSMPSSTPSSPCLEACPDGWTRFGSKCYKSVSTDQKWSECEATCANHGAQMLCIEDAATNQWVSDNLMTTTDLWLGLTDVEVEGDWEWRSGCASTYFDWGFGGPNGGSSSNCARIVYSVRPQWNDRQCNAYRYDCACEIEKDLCPDIAYHQTSREPSNEPSKEPTRQPTRSPSKDPTDSPVSSSGCSGSCPDGSWLAYDGHCFKNMDVSTAWTDCAALCASEGATMLCIPDAATNNWVSNNLMSHNCDVWIGITDEEDEGHWEWPSGCTSSYFHWASYGEPNGGSSSNCARMLYGSRPEWGDRYCSVSYDCACQLPLCEMSQAPTKAPSKSPTLPPTLSPVSESECDDGWLAYDGNCYKMVSHDETFESCDALCATEGATMLCIPDAATNAWVGNNLMTSGADLWIGLSDEATEGQWEWASGCSSTYFDWNSGAPGGGTRENCARIQYGSRPKWNDRECYFGFDCACQYNPAGGGNAPTLSPIAIAAPSSPTCSETCPDGWAGFGSKCYKSVSTDQKWSECEATCANHGAQMLCIEDAATNQWVSDNLMTTTDLWLGLTDVEVEGDWEWRSGCASTYFDWGFGGPNGGSSSNCARIVYSVRPQWNDRQCNAYRYDCACEIEKDLLCSSSEETDTPSQEPIRGPTH